MKLTLFNNDCVDAWLSDNSNNASFVCNRLNDIDIFREIKLVEHKIKQNVLHKITDIINSCFAGKQELDIDFYDEILFFNLDYQLYAIDDYYKKCKHIVTWSHYEEGILSYERDFITGKCLKLTRKLRIMVGKDDIILKIEKYYCMFPDFKESNKEWEFVKIPSISLNNVELKNILKYIFDYEISTNPYKYIYFSSPSDIDGNSFGETELVLKIAEYVGKDNLLVKMHPRDNRNIYEKHGLNIMKNSFVPWEVMCLNDKYENIVMLTTLSGAFINSSATIENNRKGIFLCDAIQSDNNYLKQNSKEIKKMLNKLHKFGLCKNVKIYNQEKIKLKQEDKR